MLKIVLSNRGLGIKANKCLYEGVIEPTTLHSADAWGMRSAKRKNCTESVDGRGQWGTGTTETEVRLDG